MKIVICTQKDCLAREIREKLQMHGYPTADVICVQTAEEVCAIRPGHSGMLIFWDYAMKDDPEEMLHRLKDMGICQCLILLAEQADIPIYRCAVNIHASAVLDSQNGHEEFAEAVEEAADQLQEQCLSWLKNRTFFNMRFAAVGQAMRGMLMHSENEGDLDLLEELGLVPRRGRPGWMILVHVANRSENTNVDRTMISTSVGNVVQELLEPLNEMRAMTWMSDEIYALFLQNRDGNEPTWEAILDVLNQARKFLSHHFGWKLNMYAAGPFLIEKAREIWVKLDDYRKENVALMPGVFHLDERREPDTFSVHSGISELRHYFNDGYVDLLEEESIKLLDELTCSGKAGRKQMRDFFQEYLKLLYSILWDNGWEGSELVQSERDQEVMNNAPNSSEDMKLLIHHVSEFLRSKRHPRSSRSVAQMLCQYIGEHYAEPLSRTQLADFIHLNPDYMARVFQKEMGCSIKEYITDRRMEAARLFLRSTNLPISEIAEKVGYENYPYFIQNYRKKYNITPKADRDDIRKRE